MTSEGSSTTLPDGTCGDGEQSDGEQCDDGNMLDNDGCSKDCIKEECGDGIVNDPSEACDNGGANSDMLTSECTTACLPPPMLPEMLEDGDWTSIFGTEVIEYDTPGCEGDAIIAIEGTWETKGVHELNEIWVECANVGLEPIGEGKYRLFWEGPIKESVPIGSGNALMPEPVQGLQCGMETPFLIGIGGSTSDTAITAVHIICVDIHVVPDDMKGYKMIIKDVDDTKVDGVGELQMPVSCEEQPGTVLRELQVHANKGRIVGFRAECGYPFF